MMVFMSLYITAEGVFVANIICSLFAWFKALYLLHTFQPACKNGLICVILIHTYINFDNYV